MLISSWLSWLGLFVVIVIVLISIKRKNKSRKIYGHFDQPIYTKPLFKGASILLLVLLAVTVFLKFNSWE